MDKSGLKQWAVGANLRKKDNMHGLVGAKNRGRGRPLKDKTGNKWISRC